MLKKTLITLTLPLLSVLAISAGNYTVRSASQTAEQIRGGEAGQKTTAAPSGTLQKMIVENGSVTMDLDLNRLRGIGFQSMSNRQNADATTLRFAIAANSFFPILVFNDQLRGPVPGSMALIQQNTGAAGVSDPGYSLPATLGASLKQLAVE